MQFDIDNYEDPALHWKVLSSERLFARPWLTVRRDHVQIPSGEINDEFYVLEYPDWVNVIALTEDGRFIFERQYRHGLGVMSLEIPAGVVEEGEAPSTRPAASWRRRPATEAACGPPTWSCAATPPPPTTTPTRS